MKKISLLIVSIIITVVVAVAQTRMDLRTQAEHVDFSAAVSTKPVKTGLALPASCTSGEVYLRISDGRGTLWTCVSDSVWTLQGGTTFRNDGASVGTEATVNILSGLGLFATLADTGTQMDVQLNADSAVMQTRRSAQSNADLYCVSSGTTGNAYTCQLASTLTQYTPGMALYWKPDVEGQAGPVTLNVDLLGAKPGKLADGTNPAPEDIIPNEMHVVWFDGNAFRMLAQWPARVSAAARPTCDETRRGRTWFATAASGTQDGFAVCAKAADDTYEWKVLY